jgi:hypothetical protein
VAEGQDANFLRTSMVKERNKWAFMTRVYGTAYVTVRIFLIVASSAVAAKTAFNASPATALLKWIPILAVLVTIFTALDTWMKPQQKWQGFMRDRDNLEDLIAVLDEAGQDTARVSEVREAFKSLRKVHRDQNVF